MLILGSFFFTHLSDLFLDFGIIVKYFKNFSFQCALFIYKYFNI